MIKQEIKVTNIYKNSLKLNWVKFHIYSNFHLTVGNNSELLDFPLLFPLVGLETRTILSTNQLQNLKLSRLRH